jgi:hypothetical protein
MISLLYVFLCDSREFSLLGTGVTNFFQKTNTFDKSTGVCGMGMKYEYEVWTMNYEMNMNKGDRRQADNK